MAPEEEKEEETVVLTPHPLECKRDLNMISKVGFFLAISFLIGLGGSPLLALSQSHPLNESYQEVRTQVLATESASEAIQLIDFFILEAVNKQDYHAIGKAEYLKGWLLHRKYDQFIGALECYFRAKSAYSKANNFAGIIDANVSIGVIFNKNGLNDNALPYYLEAVDLLKLVPDYKYAYMVHSGIGIVYRDLGENFEAIPFFERALEADVDDAERVKTLLDLGVAHQYLNDFESAIATFRKGIAMDSIQGTRNRAYLRSNLGYILWEQGDLESGLTYQKESLKIIEGSNEEYLSILPLYRLGVMTYRAGLLEEAKGYLRNSLGVYEPANKTNYDSSFLLLSQILEEEGDYKGLVQLQKDHNSRLAEEAERFKNLNDVELRVNLLVVEREYLNRDNDDFYASSNSQLINLLWGLGLMAALVMIGYYMRQAQLQKEKLQEMRQGAAAAYLDAYKFLNNED